MVARVKNSSPVTAMKASSKDIKSKKPKHGQLKRGADTKLLEEKCLLVVPHKERLGNMTITEHIVSQDKTQGLSQDETQGLSQRQLACNDLSKYASGISPLPPDNDSHSMGNKYLRFLEKSRKSAVVDSYKKFVITMGLNEQNSKKMSGIYNFRYLKLEKPIYNSIHTGKIRLTEGQEEEKSDPMHKVKNSGLLFRFHNTASNGNLESAKLEQHCFEDKCGKEDNGTKGLSLERKHVGSGGLEQAGWTCGNGLAICSMKYFHQSYFKEPVYLKKLPIKIPLVTMNPNHPKQQIIA
ncbi:uncharacterized protein LOC135200068 [Macrobrachium nipponense]|uniref:uncharacterized protein LOC135200068 n=1 Tax=Macrobrachium nipponense TaxID=159736 RepID=UPI0030C7C4A7